MGGNPCRGRIGAAGTGCAPVKVSESLRGFDTGATRNGQQWGCSFFYVPAKPGEEEAMLNMILGYAALTVIVGFEVFCLAIMFGGGNDD